MKRKEKKMKKNGGNTKNRKKITFHCSFKEERR
jgi:hypothetical protein